MIPDVDNISESIELAEKYDLGFEYNDFYWPEVLDDSQQINEIISKYDMYELPRFTTMHGAFFDVIPFSVDDKIRQISKMRIEQSIDIAKRIGASAVVFHTNYNPFLNAKDYVTSWLEDNVEYWSSVLEKHKDINIYLENMFDTTPDIMQQLSERLSKYKNYGVCFDYAHASLSKVELRVWAEKLGKYIKHVHINDNDGMSDLHLAWGEGIINREIFYECYENYFKDATVLIEVSQMDSKIASIELLEKEGFLK